MSQIILKKHVVVCCTVLFALTSAVTSNELVYAESGMQEELQARLSENLKQDALIQQQMRTALGVATRPHSAYLLHQKSLGLQNSRDRLQFLRKERAELLQMIRGLPDKSRVSEALLLQAQQAFSMENIRRHSGSPMLAFQQAPQVYREASAETPLRVDLFHVMIAGFLLTAFALPLIAIFRRGEPISVHKRLVRVFPMFTVYGAHGRREMLKIQMDTQGKMLSI